MTAKDAIEYFERILLHVDMKSITGLEAEEAINMAISALQAQGLKQEVKKSRCTYKPDCPWYDGSKCNSPNDPGYHECDYDRGIFPESYEENVKNSTESSLTQKKLDTISRQANCVYCHEDSDGYVKPIEKNNHAFVRFGMNGWELSLKANGWYGSAKIRYCPMCGRRLERG